jgi:hypothetical protein
LPAKATAQTTPKHRPHRIYVGADSSAKRAVQPLQLSRMNSLPQNSLPQDFRQHRNKGHTAKPCGGRLSSPDNTETPATPDLCGSGFIREEGGAAATAFANEFAPTEFGPTEFAATGFQATPKQRRHRIYVGADSSAKRAVQPLQLSRMNSLPQNSAPQNLLPQNFRQHRNKGHTAKPCGGRLSSPGNTETPATPDLCGSGFIREEGGAATTAFANEFAPTGFAATERTPTKWTLTNEPTQNPAPHTPFMQPKIFHRCAVR